MVRSIAIVSLGQGNGKTTLALNLGLALRALGHKVLVMDADFTKDNMIEHLDLHDMPTDLSQVLEGDTHIHDAVLDHFTGLKILPSRVHGYDRLSYHYQDLLGDYDYIILDTPSGFKELENVLQNADEALIVHGPGYSSKTVMDAMEMLSRLKVLNLGIVLNRFSERSANELLGQPIIEKIPSSREIERSYRLKNPVVHTHPKSDVSKKFHRIAKRFG